MRCGDTVESSGGSGSIPSINSGSANALNEGDSSTFGIVMNPISCCVFFGSGDITVANDNSGDVSSGVPMS